MADFKSVFDVFSFDDDGSYEIKDYKQYQTLKEYNLIQFGKTEKRPILGITVDAKTGQNLLVYGYNNAEFRYQGNQNEWGDIPIFYLLENIQRYQNQINIVNSVSGLKIPDELGKNLDLELKTTPLGFSEVGGILYKVVINTLKLILVYYREYINQFGSIPLTKFLELLETAIASVYVVGGSYPHYINEYVNKVSETIGEVGDKETFVRYLGWLLYHQIMSYLLIYVYKVSKEDGIQKQIRLGIAYAQLLASNTPLIVFSISREILKRLWIENLVNNQITTINEVIGKLGELGVIHTEKTFPYLAYTKYLIDNNYIDNTELVYYPQLQTEKYRICKFFQYWSGYAQLQLDNINSILPAEYTNQLFQLWDKYVNAQLHLKLKYLVKTESEGQVYFAYGLTKWLYGFVDEIEEVIFDVFNSWGYSQLQTKWHLTYFDFAKEIGKTEVGDTLPTEVITDGNKLDEIRNTENYYFVVFDLWNKRLLCDDTPNSLLKHTTLTNLLRYSTISKVYDVVSENKDLFYQLNRFYQKQENQVEPLVEGEWEWTPNLVEEWLNKGYIPFEGNKFVRKEIWEWVDNYQYGIYTDTTKSNVGWGFFNLSDHIQTYWDVYKGKIHTNPNKLKWYGSELGIRPTWEISLDYTSWKSLVWKVYPNSVDWLIFDESKDNTTDNLKRWYQFSEVNKLYSALIIAVGGNHSQPPKLYELKEITDEDVNTFNQFVSENQLNIADLGNLPLAYQIYNAVKIWSWVLTSKSKIEGKTITELLPELDIVSENWDNTNEESLWKSITTLLYVIGVGGQRPTLHTSIVIPKLTTYQKLLWLKGKRQLTNKPSKLFDERKVLDPYKPIPYISVFGYILNAVGGIYAQLQPNEVNADENIFHKLDIGNILSEDFWTRLGVSLPDNNNILDYSQLGDNVKTKLLKVVYYTYFDLITTLLEEWKNIWNYNLVYAITPNLKQEWNDKYNLVASYITEILNWNEQPQQTENSVNVLTNSKFPEVGGIITQYLNNQNNTTSNLDVLLNPIITTYTNKILGMENESEGESWALVSPTEVENIIGLYNYYLQENQTNATDNLVEITPNLMKQIVIRWLGVATTLIPYLLTEHIISELVGGNWLNTSIFQFHYIYGNDVYVYRKVGDNYQYQLDKQFGVGLGVITPNHQDITTIKQIFVNFLSKFYEVPETYSIYYHNPRYNIPNITITLDTALDINKNIPLFTEYTLRFYKYILPTLDITDDFILHQVGGSHTFQLELLPQEWLTQINTFILTLTNNLITQGINNFPNVYTQIQNYQPNFTLKSNNPLLTSNHPTQPKFYKYPLYLGLNGNEITIKEVVGRISTYLPKKLEKVLYEVERKPYTYVATTNYNGLGVRLHPQPYAVMELQKERFKIYFGRKVYVKLERYYTPNQFEIYTNTNTKFVSHQNAYFKHQWIVNNEYPSILTTPTIKPINFIRLGVSDNQNDTINHQLENSIQTNIRLGVSPTITNVISYIKPDYNYLGIFSNTQSENITNLENTFNITNQFLSLLSTFKLKEKENG